MTLVIHFLPHVFLIASILILAAVALWQDGCVRWQVGPRRGNATLWSESKGDEE